MGVGRGVGRVSGKDSDPSCFKDLILQDPMIKTMCNPLIQSLNSNTFICQMILCQTNLPASELIQTMS